LEQLFAAHYGDLVRYATRRVGATRQATSSPATFLIAWRRLADVPADHSRAWLYAAARNVIANELRGRERRERLGQRARAQAAPATGDHAGLVTEQLRVRGVLAELAPPRIRATSWPSPCSNAYSRHRQAMRRHVTIAPRGVGSCWPASSR
jgi:RNA polymerase sigma-70 factor (ECF subfamily)